MTTTSTRRSSTWSGANVRHARATIAPTLPRPCGRCRKTVHPTDRWVVGHIKSRHAYPELTLVPSNWQPEHRACSDRSSGEAIAEKALRDAGVLPAPSTVAAPLPRSLSDAHAAPFLIPDDLSWATFVQAAPTWLKPYLDPDESSSPPLAVSPLHPDAVGSYAEQCFVRAVCPEGAIAWIEAVEGKTLRWWQRLGLVLKLQHDADGRLLKRDVTETGPRRAGKSVGLRGLAMWRMEHGAELFGERQEIIHTGSDLAVCRKAQKEAWRWAKLHWGPRSVTAGNGKESIETPGGDVWLVRAQLATYGWDTTLALVDEGWDVQPATVSEGLEPSLMGRHSPQMVMTSTSHRRATSTMRTALAVGLSENDPAALVLWWGAPPGADPSDPEVWRAASPYWDEERAAFVASKYAKALAGEDDPEFDDPDPVRGFECQFLNRWDLRSLARAGESKLVDAEAWGRLTAAVPAGPPAAVAVESWFADGVSVAFAWRLGDHVLVAVVGVPDLGSAAASVAASGFRGTADVGASIATDPAWAEAKVKVRAAAGHVVGAVLELDRLLAAEVLRHDGGEQLTEQVLAVRTAPGANGPRLRSQTRADGVKAAAWAAAAARSAGPGRPRIVLPAGVRRT
ncbi:MAG TPA: HNH endonuclease [Nocardioides sp.]|uniref:HNH endonuclease n=1 Tax=Nocardioides sp. TaxID=35761 RepID=UPI002EDB9954